MSRNKLRSPQKPEQGRYQAQLTGGGINNPEVREILKDFHRLNTEGARAAFADGWVRMTSRSMDATWAVFYQLLCIIREKKLYESPDFMAEGRTFATFKDYWEQVVRKPFATFAELESTYHFVAENAPDLFACTFSEAASEVIRLKTHGGDRRSEEFQEEKEPVQASVTSLKSIGKRCDKDYLRARLRRDHPSIFDRLEAGEFRSVRAAALEAGIVQPYVSLPLLPNSAAAAIRRHFSPEAITELIRLLSEPSPEAEP
jgi:HEAT repeat protein